MNNEFQAIELVVNKRELEIILQALESQKIEEEVITGMSKGTPEYFRECGILTLTNSLIKRINKLLKGL